jgi:hypothetical protein
MTLRAKGREIVLSIGKIGRGDRSNRGPDEQRASNEQPDPHL